MLRIGRINARAIAELADMAVVKRHEKMVAERVLNEARRLAPFRTGTLRSSLTVEESRGFIGGTEFRIGWNPNIADYGPPVEFGTGDTAPRPHLRTAAIKVRGR